MVTWGDIVTCPNCGGQGRFPDGRLCALCKGSGQIPAAKMDQGTNKVRKAVKHEKKPKHKKGKK